MKTTLLILILIGCSIVSIVGLFKKKNNDPNVIGNMYENESEKFSYPEDPLFILREDTYSNEEINEMTGRQIREQYKYKNS